MKKLFMKKNGKKSKGQSLVEYGLILALVSVVAITVLQTMGSQIKQTVSGLSTKLEETKWSGLCTESGGVWVGLDATASAAANALPNASGTAVASPCVCMVHPTTNVDMTYEDPGTIDALGGLGQLVGAGSGKCV